MNYEFFDNITPETAEVLIEALGRGERPTPTRGAPLCSFKEISRQLAGFRDPRPEVTAAGSAHPEPATSPDSRGSESPAAVHEAGPTPQAGIPRSEGEYAVAEPEATGDLGELAASEPEPDPEMFQRTNEESANS